MGSPPDKQNMKTKEISFDSGMILMQKKLVQLDPLLRRMIVNLMFAPTGAFPSLLARMKGGYHMLPPGYVLWPSLPSSFDMGGIWRNAKPQGTQ